MSGRCMRGGGGFDSIGIGAFDILSGGGGRGLGGSADGGFGKPGGEKGFDPIANGGGILRG